jgi:membrane protein YqaA with SNARE-associated domain
LKWLLRKITNGLTTVTQFLLAFGAFGLFAIALLDSALIPLPGGPDAVMILLSSAHPSWVLVYAFAGTAGSVVGCLFLYYVSRKAGSRALDRFSIERQARVKRLIDRYDVLSILVASVLPPPFPFKLFVISTGVFRLSPVRFVIAIALGRGFRFLLEGYLAVQFGDRATELLKLYYPSIGIGLAFMIIVGFAVKTILQRRKGGKVIESEG